jgi:hypothetical protein
MNLALTLLKSKRTWVMIITLALHLLAKYHVVLSGDDVNAIADQFVFIVGAAGIVGTKIIDSKQAQLSAPAQIPAVK